MFDPQIVYNSLQPRARSSSDHLMYQMEMNLASNRSRVGDELCRLATSQPIRLQAIRHSTTARSNLTISREETTTKVALIAYAYTTDGSLTFQAHLGNLVCSLCNAFS
ncbi:hypothetical protein Tcan_07299 [Toxocara canis]|uniref:Uncharacterized protein n=1 Tax=Toxocara canis TaxID=6265 RepID=A0A0B2VA55_TOXCA|nr:hypothetical protein Tcan_07299 [Toxocara canis]